VLQLTREAWMAMIGHAYDGLPDEACGMLAGPKRGPGTRGIPALERITTFYPCRNAAASSRYYTIDDEDLGRAYADADARGLELIGTMHSHTHTDAYPSPTDVGAADPWFHYVIVSLRQEAPVLRAFRIRDDAIDEEPVQLV
jgi:proteasome lid subunit RPN8/RPN11